MDFTSEDAMNTSRLKPFSSKGMFSVIQDSGHNMSYRARTKQTGLFLNPKYIGHLEIVESSLIQKNLVSVPEKCYFCLDFLSGGCFERNFVEESTSLKPCMFWFTSKDHYNIFKLKTEGVDLHSKEFQEKVSEFVSGIIVLNLESDVKTSRVGTGLYFVVTKSRLNGICNSWKFRAESVADVEKWVFYIQCLLTEWFHLEKDLKSNSQKYRKCLGLDHLSKTSAMEALESNKEQMPSFVHKHTSFGRDKRATKQYFVDEIFAEQYRSPVL